MHFKDLISERSKSKKTRLQKKRGTFSKGKVSKTINNPRAIVNLKKYVKQNVRKFVK